MKHRLFNMLLGLTIGGMVIPLSSLVGSGIVCVQWKRLIQNPNLPVTAEKLVFFIWLNMLGTLSGYDNSYLIWCLTVVTLPILYYIFMSTNVAIKLMSIAGGILLLVKLGEPEWNPLLWHPVAMQLFVLAATVLLYLQVNHPTKFLKRYTYG